MEAPEKIFICDYGSEVSYEWHSESEFEAKGHNDIEYTRTDAFIEKACVKLKKLMYDNLMFQGRLHREEVIDNFIDDFKYYMQEE